MYILLLHSGLCFISLGSVMFLISDWEAAFSNQVTWSVARQLWWISWGKSGMWNSKHLNLPPCFVFLPITSHRKAVAFKAVWRREANIRTMQYVTWRGLLGLLLVKDWAHPTAFCLLCFCFAFPHLSSSWAARHQPFLESETAAVAARPVQGWQLTFSFISAWVFWVTQGREGGRGGEGCI